MPRAPKKPRIVPIAQPGPVETWMSSGPSASVTGTGRMLVVLGEQNESAGLAALKSAAGMTKVARASDFAGSSFEMAQVASADVVMLDELNVAIVNTDPSQASALMATAGDGRAIIAAEPERIMYAIDEGGLRTSLQQTPLQYLRGYRDAVNHLYDTLSKEQSAGLEQTGFAEQLADADRYTWGLQATRVIRSKFAGKNVRIAVLDTGMDLNHPDFVGRSIVHASFIQGEAVQDSNGHGTHCIGTAMGSSIPATGVRRYGCASGAEIYVGKVLSNAGSGADGGILSGINWAIANKCRIISMSLGAPTSVGERPSPTYEIVAQRALHSRSGTIIIAAAGNNSRRDLGQPPKPVSRPANCPSIMAVGAVDSAMGIASFSDGGINPDGGGVDIAAPGVRVFSSLPVAHGNHGSLSGTSMATPHVAGIAAMWLEARGHTTTAQDVWQLLTSKAMRLNLPSRDVGAGLVQAPV